MKNATAKLGEVKKSFATFWEARNRRERNMLIAASVVVVIGLFYALFIDPAVSGRENLQKRLPVLRQQAAELQALAKDTATLSAKASASVPAVTRETLEASLTARGMKPQNVAMTGELAKVQLASVSFAGTMGWLDEMQRSARLTVVDANVEALAQPDTVNATFTLRQQKGEGAQ